MEDTYIATTRVTVTALTPNNYRQWIEDIKGFALQHEVWEYVDPEGTEVAPTAPKYPRVTDYYRDVVQPGAAVPVRTRCADYDDLDESQKKSYAIKERAYKSLFAESKAATSGVAKVYAAVMESAREYVPITKRTAIVRDIIISLAEKFKQSDSKLRKQIDVKYEQLKNSNPVKGKTEQWIQEWESLRDEMAYMKIDTTYNEELFTEHFLRAGRPFAPDFCDHWAREKVAAGRELEFRETTREYRTSVDQFMAKSKSKGANANAATWQGIQQPHSNNNSQSNDQKGQNDRREAYRGRPCVCGQIHLFDEDPYLNLSARPSGWKSIPSERKAIRETIKKNAGFYFAIKKFCNTDILDGISFEDTRSQRRSKSKESSKDNNAVKLPASANSAYADRQGNGGWSFASMAMAQPDTSALSDSSSPDRRENLLKNSVQYDPCSTYHLTWDSSRFIDDIRSEFEWVSSPGGELLIEGRGTMLVKGHLNGKRVDLRFPNTAYAPKANCTLIAGMKLKREGFHWDMSIDKVVYKGEPIFEVNEHIGMPVVEYNPIGHLAAYANYVGPRAVGSLPKAIPWIFHQRLGHCQPEVIKQLAQAGEIELLEGKDAPKTVQCQTCATSKMHQFVAKTPSLRASRPFERLCMDLIILGVAWDGTTCIAHFYDECTSNHWVFPLSDHKQETLSRVMKHIINHCDRQGFESRFAVQIIRQDQETSVGNKIQEFVQNQGLVYEWSAKDTKEQNGASERTGSMLSQMARSIRIGAHLPEDLYPECYLAAAHLLNRIPTKRFNWKSPQEMLKKALAKPHKSEIAHLKVYGCKAYPLLKGKSAPPKSEKLKPRAFIGYLVGYDSTNIYRIWNPETGTVSGYRDVIFDETSFYDTYQKEDLITEKERANFVDLLVYDTEPYVPDLDEGEEEWLITSIRDRSAPTTATSAPLPVPAGSLETLKGPMAPFRFQQPTPDSTPPPPDGQHVAATTSTPSAPAPRPRGRPRKEPAPTTEQVDTPTTEQVNIPKRPRGKPRKDAQPTEKELESLPETGDTPLGMPKPKPAKSIGTATLDTADVIEGKRVRKPKTPFASSAMAINAVEDVDNETEFWQAFANSTISTPPLRLHRNDLPPPPKHWRSMLRHPHCVGFKEAAEAEYKALKEIGTFKVVPKHYTYKPLPLMWVFNYKFDPSGYLTKYKSRLVVRGDLEPLSAEDVYAATLAVKLLRCLVALVGAYGLKTRQLDAIQAFLNALTDRLVHCYMPDGFPQEGMCLLLLRALYGLRKSPLLWLKELTTTLTKLGLHPVPGEPCLFTDQKGILLFFYVDDIVFIFAVHREQDVEELIRKLKKVYEFRDLGQLRYFLGIRIIHDTDNSRIYMCQDSYIDKLVKDYKIDINSKPPSTPLPPNENLVKYEGETNPDRVRMYRKKVGSISYPANITRPDIAKTASKLAEFLINPAPEHEDAADHCLRYLAATKFLAIEFTAWGGGELTAQVPNEELHVFENTADASFANDLDRRSAEGYTFKLFGGCIDWAARKQTTVSTSTTEAELLALLHAGKACIWWMKLFNKIGFDYDHKVTIYNDNLQTIRVLTSEADKINTRLLHVDVAQLWLRQSVKVSYLDVQYLPTAQMTADGLTKLLPPQKHQNFIKMLGMVDIERLVAAIKEEDQ